MFRPPSRARTSIPPSVRSIDQLLQNKHELVRHPVSFPLFSPSFYLKMSNDFELFLRTFAEVPLHRQRRSRTFFDGAVDETAPADGPVGVGEEDVALAGTEV